MYKLKQKPEDFRVKELIEPDFDDSGGYSYYLLTKTKYNTSDAVKAIAKKLNIKPKDIGYAGNKDRNAITQQFISIKNCNKQDLELKDIMLEFKGKGKNPISLGDNKGNQFEIIIRNIEKTPKQISQMINSFGEQRFSKNNTEIGKALLKKDFKKACELIDEFVIKESLEKNPTDFVGALRRLSKKHLTIYINSFQSKLWNLLAEKFPNEEELPLVGFGTEFNNKEIGHSVTHFLDDEGITQTDFIIRQIPEISSEGNTRKTKVKIDNLEIGSLEDDELNQGKKKSKVKFILPKGSYATEAVKQMF